MLFRTFPCLWRNAFPQFFHSFHAFRQRQRNSSKKHFSISIFEMTHETRTDTLQKFYWYPRVSKIEIEKGHYWDRLTRLAQSFPVKLAFLPLFYKFLKIQNIYRDEGLQALSQCVGKWMLQVCPAAKQCGWILWHSENGNCHLRTSGSWQNLNAYGFGYCVNNCKFCKSQHFGVAMQIWFLEHKLLWVWLGIVKHLG